MKKFSKILLILCITFGFNCYTISVLACSNKETNGTTGSACSISELNNLDANKIKRTIPIKKQMNKQIEQNLYPLQTNSNIGNVNYDDCLFGIYIPKKLFRE